MQVAMATAMFVSCGMCLASTLNAAKKYCYLVIALMPSCKHREQPHSWQMLHECCVKGAI